MSSDNVLLLMPSNMSTGAIIIDNVVFLPCHVASRTDVPTFYIYPVYHRTCDRSILPVAERPQPRPPRSHRHCALLSCSVRVRDVVMILTTLKPASTYPLVVYLALDLTHTRLVQAILSIAPCYAQAQPLPFTSAVTRPLAWRIIRPSLEPHMGLGHAPLDRVMLRGNQSAKQSRDAFTSPVLVVSATMPYIGTSMNRQRACPASHLACNHFRCPESMVNA